MTDMRWTVRNPNATIESLHETGGTVRLDTGEAGVFDRGSCYRDGTSFPSMRVGDRCRYDGDVFNGKAGISAPNAHRWNNPSAD